MKNLNEVVNRYLGEADVIETPDFTVAQYTGNKHKGNKIYKDGSGSLWLVDKKTGMISLVDKNYKVIM